MSTTKIKEIISAGSRETKDSLLPFVEALKDQISALWNNAAIPRLANDEGDDEFEPHACAMMEVDVESANYDNAMRAARDIQDSSCSTVVVASGSPSWTSGSASCQIGEVVRWPPSLGVVGGPLDPEAPPSVELNSATYRIDGP